MTVTPDSARMARIIDAVVVLPFVPETNMQPSGSKDALRATKFGANRSRMTPGRLDPAPAPARRESFPATRATASAITSVYFPTIRCGDGAPEWPKPARDVLRIDRLEAVGWFPARASGPS